MDENRVWPPIHLDFFKGNVADFREYLKAQRLLLKAGATV